jgi:hypothetical protein
MYIPSVKPTVYTDGNIPSVYTDGITDGMIPSVYTDRFWDGIMSVDINYRRNISVGNSVAFLRFSGSDEPDFLILGLLEPNPNFNGQKTFLSIRVGIRRVLVKLSSLDMTEPKCIKSGNSIVKPIFTWA